MSPQYSSLQSGVDVGVIGIGDGVNVAVGVLVGVRDVVVGVLLIGVEK